MLKKALLAALLVGAAAIATVETAPVAQAAGEIKLAQVTTGRSDNMAAAATPAKKATKKKKKKSKKKKAKKGKKAKAKKPAKKAKK